MNSGYEFPVLGYGVRTFLLTLQKVSRLSEHQVWQTFATPNSQIPIPITILKLITPPQPSIRPASECVSVVTHAFTTGDRHVNNAVKYDIESPCGLAIRQSSIPREEIFHTTRISQNKWVRLNYENYKEPSAKEP